MSRSDIRTWWREARTLPKIESGLEWKNPFAERDVQEVTAETYRRCIQSERLGVKFHLLARCVPLALIAATIVAVALAPNHRLVATVGFLGSAIFWEILVMLTLSSFRLGHPGIIAKLRADAALEIMLDEIASGRPRAPGVWIESFVRHSIERRGFPMTESEEAALCRYLAGEMRWTHFVGGDPGTSTRNLIGALSRYGRLAETRQLLTRFAQPRWNVNRRFTDFCAGAAGDFGVGGNS